MPQIQSIVCFSRNYPMISTKAKDMNIEPDLDEHVESEISAEEFRLIRLKAEQNAEALGIGRAEWQVLRKIQNPIIADLLMAFDPQRPEGRPADGPRAAARPLGRLRIDELVGELREARRMRDVGRLKQLLDELRYRKSRIAARLAASVRLSLLALERPDLLPFRCA